MSTTNTGFCRVDYLVMHNNRLYYNANDVTIAAYKVVKISCVQTFLV